MNIVQWRRPALCWETHLKDDFTERSHGDTISIGQSKGLVIIQNGIQVLNPNSIYGTIQKEPDGFSLFSNAT